MCTLTEPLIGGPEIMILVAVFSTLPLRAASLGTGHTEQFRIFDSSQAQASVGCDRVLAYLSSACIEGELLIFTPGASCRSLRFPVSGPALSRFLSQSQRLRLDCLDPDINHCQALAGIEPADDMEIELRACEPTDEGTRALLEGVRNSRGPSAFVNCRNIDNDLLLEALGGNTNVKVLALSHVNDDDDGRDENPPLPMLALADNLGLVVLDFCLRPINDETLCVMCESLATHPTIENLDLRHTLPSPDDGGDDESTISFESRTNSLVDLLRVNTKITSIDLTRREFDESLLDNEVYPRLKLNSYRPRFRAVKRIEGTLREPLLGRALGAVAHDASLVFLLFSGSTEIDWVAIGRTRRSRKRIRYAK